MGGGKFVIQIDAEKHVTIHWYIGHNYIHVYNFCTWNLHMPLAHTPFVPRPLRWRNVWWNAVLRTRCPETLLLTESDGKTCEFSLPKIGRYGKKCGYPFKSTQIMLFFKPACIKFTLFVRGDSNYERSSPSIWSQWVSSMNALDLLELQGVVGVFTIITDGRFRSSSFATRRLWRKILWRRTTVVNIFWIHSWGGLRKQKKSIQEVVYTLHTHKLLPPKEEGDINS